MVGFCNEKLGVDDPEGKEEDSRDVIDIVISNGSEEEEDGDDDDDDEGWINPGNVEQACIEMGGVMEEKPVGVAVGCVTTDFAMQV